jgi:hypothetical protein
MINNIIDLFCNLINYKKVTDIKRMDDLMPKGIKSTIKSKYHAKLLDNNNTDIKRMDDLIPKGIKSTIKSKSHGQIEDYNNAWVVIYSQIRNLNKI